MNTSNTRKRIHLTTDVKMFSFVTFMGIILYWALYFGNYTWNNTGNYTGNYTWNFTPGIILGILLQIKHRKHCLCNKGRTINIASSRRCLIARKGRMASTDS